MSDIDFSMFFGPNFNPSTYESGWTNFLAGPNYSLLSGATRTMSINLSSTVDSGLPQTPIEIEIRYFSNGQYKFENHIFPQGTGSVDFEIGPFLEDSIGSPSIRFKNLGPTTGAVRIQVDDGLDGGLSSTGPIWFGSTNKPFDDSSMGANTDECFPAHTLITLSNRTQKPIADIRIGDSVLAFDGAGALQPRKVSKLFTNATEQFIELSNGLVVTPGHRFVRPDGEFMTIEEILQKDGQIILEDGTVETVTGTYLRYNVTNAELFEQITLSKHLAQGALAAKPQEVTGWKTYTFEVEELHSYEAANDNTLIRKAA